MSPEKSPVIDRGQRARSRSNLLLLLAAGVTDNVTTGTLQVGGLREAKPPSFAPSCSKWGGFSALALVLLRKRAFRCLSTPRLPVSVSWKFSGCMTQEHSEAGKPSISRNIHNSEMYLYDSNNVGPRLVKLDCK